MDSLLIQSGKDTVIIQEENLDPSQVIEAVTSPNCGAIDVFIGTVRNQTQGKAVVRLEFEAYEAMALKEMQKIVERTREQWPVQHMAMVHRTGY